MPVAPQIVEALDNVSPVQGGVGYGGYTNDATPVVRVRLGDQAEAGQTLTVAGDRIAASSMVAISAEDVANGFVLVPTALLPEGWNQLSAALRRADGTTVATSMFFALGVATAAPAAPTITGATDDAGAVTGALSSGARTDDLTPTFQIYEAGLPPAPQGSPGHAPFGGPALFGGRVLLYAGDRLVGEASLGYDAPVSITPGALSAGEHVLTAVAVDRAGNVSAASAPFSLTIAEDGGPVAAPSAQPSSGDDLLHAAPGFLRIEAGAGADTIIGADATELLRGGSGDDSIVGGTQFNDINGNQGQDTIIGRSVIGDWLLGGQGEDVINARASSGANIINGNMGADTVEGGAGADSVRGGQGDDVLLGGDGADWLSGDMGADTLTGGAGADLFHIFRGSGQDLVTDFDGAAGDRVHIEAGARWSVSTAGADTVVSVDGARLVLAGVGGFSEGWIVQV